MQSHFSRHEKELHLGKGNTKPNILWVIRPSDHLARWQFSRTWGISWDSVSTVHVWPLMMVGCLERREKLLVKTSRWLWLIWIYRVSLCLSIIKMFTLFMGVIMQTVGPRNLSSINKEASCGVVLLWIKITCLPHLNRQNPTYVTIDVLCFSRGISFGLTLFLFNLFQV